MLHVSLRQLEYVVAVGKAGSLSMASARLNVSQPALSVAIAQVEARIGERLFLRRKGVAFSPTAFGRLFLKDAEALILAAERLERPGALSQRTVDHVTLGILDELAPGWFGPILVQLGTRFEGLRVQVIPLPFPAMVDNLLAGRIDLGLTYDLGLDAGFRRDLLVRVAPWAWVGPADELAGRSEVSLSELGHRPLILSDQGLSIQHMLGLFRRIGSEPVVRHRASSVELLRSLAANGEGTGLSYTNPAGNVTHDGKPVVRLRVSDDFAVESLVLAHVGDQPEPLPQIRSAIQDLARRAQT
jgi:DNA-binding transcriptional LysR family regulator